MSEIRDAEAEKYCNKIDNNVAEYFKAGFDCRDKLGDEALKVAVEALDNILTEYVEDECDIDYNPHTNPAFRIASQALAKISELRGEG
jgi:hypothetical protein